MNSKENFILKATFEFSLLIVNYCEILISKKKFAIADQFIRSGHPSVPMCMKLNILKAGLILYIR